MSARTPAEVAAEVGATEWFIREKARAGLIPCLRVGRKAIRFTDEHVAEIVRFLERPAMPLPAQGLTTSRSRARRRSA